MSFAEEVQAALRVFVATIRVAAEREALAMLRRLLERPMTEADALRLVIGAPPADARRPRSEALVRLVAYVRVNPGRSVKEIAEGMGVHLRTAQEYLRIASADAQIRRVECASPLGGRTKRYYANDSTDPPPYDHAHHGRTDEAAHEAAPVGAAPSSSDDLPTIPEGPRVSARAGDTILASGSPEP